MEKRIPDLDTTSRFTLDAAGVRTTGPEHPPESPVSDYDPTQFQPALPDALIQEVVRANRTPGGGLYHTSKTPQSPNPKHDGGHIKNVYELRNVIHTRRGGIKHTPAPQHIRPKPRRYNETIPRGAESARSAAPQSPLAGQRPETPRSQAGPSDRHVINHRKHGRFLTGIFKPSSGGKHRAKRGR